MRKILTPLQVPPLPPPFPPHPKLSQSNTLPSCARSSPLCRSPPPSPHTPPPKVSTRFFPPAPTTNRGATDLANQGLVSLKDLSLEDLSFCSVFNQCQINSTFNLMVAVQAGKIPSSLKKPRSGPVASAMTTRYCCRGLGSSPRLTPPTVTLWPSCTGSTTSRATPLPPTLRVLFAGRLYVGHIFSFK